MHIIPQEESAKKKLVNSKIVKQGIQVTSDIKTTFKAPFQNILENYILPYVESDALVQRLRSNWMLFW